MFSKIVKYSSTYLIVIVKNFQFIYLPNTGQFCVTKITLFSASSLFDLLRMQLFLFNHVDDLSFIKERK